VVSEALEIPKNTVYRILTTLTDYGYLARDEQTNLYRLERKILSLGYKAIDESSLIERCLDVLRELRDETGESVFLAVQLGNQGVTIEQLPGLHPVKVLSEIGHRFPMYTSAPGKALMAYLPEAEAEEVIRNQSYKKHTARTITGIKAMRAELETVRHLGYSLDQGEELEDLHCVGAPVLNHRGHAIAAIWVSALASVIREEHFEEVGAQVRSAALRISKRYGYQTDE
jgi:DNA-binding IclR family transcriptional regulator